MNTVLATSAVATPAETPLPVVLLIVVLIAVAAATGAAVAVRSRLRRRLEDAERAHRAELAAHEASAAAVRARLQQQEAMSVNALEAERILRGEQVDALLAQLSHGMKWEQTSREFIRRETAALQVDGVLVTNLFLLTADEGGAPFVTQIDHLLVTAQTIVVVEAKHWRGVVFDDVDPATLHPALAPVSASLKLPSSFAIHLRSGRNTPLSVDLRPSPRAQARAQAAHLSRMLKAEHDQVSWIQTAVLYSHPEVRLFSGTRPAGDSRGHVQTPALDSTSFRAFLRGALGRSTDKPNDARSIVRSLEPHAADVVGLGEMSGEWPDFFRTAVSPGATRQPLQAQPSPSPSSL